MSNITITDVAKHAGVSKSTVSQYLNNRFEYMGAKTKQKIKKSIEELGYQPNYVARSLKQKSTTTIGVIVANILHEFSTQVIRAIEDVCNELGFHIIVCNADDEPEKEKQYIDVLRAKQIDGMIIFPTGGNIELYKRMETENYPVVFVDRHIPELQINSVLLHNEQASALAVDEFVKKGYEHIAIITSSLLDHITPRLERVQGYKKALETHDLPIRPELIKSVNIEDIQTELAQMLELPTPPQAILAGNDRTFIEILRFVKKHQISIPDELALIGIDDVTFAEIYQPSLTTIAQPTFEMGRQAAEILLDKIMNKNTEEKQANIYRFEPTLISRSSC